MRRFLTWPITVGVLVVAVLASAIFAVLIEEDRRENAVAVKTDELSLEETQQVVQAVSQWWQNQQARRASLAKPPAPAPAPTPAPTTTTVPPPPCPKSPEEAAQKLGGNASNWSVLPGSDGMGWKYEGGTVALTHPGYGRLDTPIGEVSSGTVRVSVATLWCLATGGEPAESLGTPAPASSPQPSRAPASQPAPAPAQPTHTHPAPTQPASAPSSAPSCPAFGGAATVPEGDDGRCKYRGAVMIASVPSGYKAIYWDHVSQQTLTGCSGQEIQTGDASFYQDDGSCVSSPPPATGPAPSPGPNPDSTPPPSDGCPMGTPTDDGGCFVKGWPEGAKVPDGWWANTEFGRIDSGKVVPTDAHATLYRNGT